MDIDSTETKHRTGWLIAGLGLAAGLALWLPLRARLHRMTLNRLSLFPRNIGERTPAELAMPYEEVWFSARDGIRLHGWYIPAPDNGVAASRRNTIIMGHGHTASKEPDLEYTAIFHRAGYNIFMFDFRGHGRSEGVLGSSMGYWERLDVHGAVDWLVGRGQDRLAAFGISMGAAILIMAAAENPFIRAVIADSPYAHLYRPIAAELNNIYHLPLWLARPLAHYAWRIMAGHHRFPRRTASPADYVARLAPRPLLLIHGEEDTLTRVENAYILYRLAHSPKELWIQPGVSHAAGLSSLGLQYEQRLLDFLDRIDWDSPVRFEVPGHTLEGQPAR